jgi:hypothetical protein
MKLNGIGHLTQPVHFVRVDAPSVPVPNVSNPGEGKFEPLGRAADSAFGGMASKPRFGATLNQFLRLADKTMLCWCFANHIRCSAFKVARRLFAYAQLRHALVSPGRLRIYPHSRDPHMLQPGGCLDNDSILAWLFAWGTNKGSDFRVRKTSSH